MKEIKNIFAQATRHVDGAKKRRNITNFFDFFPALLRIVATRGGLRTTAHPS